MLPDCGLLKSSQKCRVNATLPWNSNQLVDAFILNLLHVTVNLSGGSVILVGIVSSFLCVLVFSCYSITLRTTRRLLILNSVTDVVYLCCFGCATILIGLHRKDLRSTLIRDWFYAVANIVELFRNWTIAVIAFERVILLCYPIYFKSTWNFKRVTYLIIVIGVLSILLRMTSILTLIYQYNGSCSIAAKLFIFDALIDVILLTFLPMLLLSFFSARIFIEIQRLQQWRCYFDAVHYKRDFHYRQYEWRIHRTLLLILLLFTILSIPFLPNGVLRVLQAAGVGDCRVFLWQRITSVVAYVGTLLNSTINCFVYLICWPRFRRTVWRLLTDPIVVCLNYVRKRS